MPPLNTFISYSSLDENLRQDLERHLALLKREGVIETWTFRDIEAGDDWKNEISKQLESAQLILLLISASFMASDYCWTVEMTRAIQKHREGFALVIPIILRDCDWNSAPFAALQALPPAVRPVTSWKPQDKAWKAVAEGIRRSASSFSSSSAGKPESQVAKPESAIQRAVRLKAESAKRQKRNEIVRDRGYSVFVAEVGAVYEMIDRKAEEIRSETGLTVECGYRTDHCIARLKSTVRSIWPLTLHLYQNWDGELAKSHLNVRLLIGGMVLPQESGIVYPYKPKQRSTARYSLILTDDERWLWHQKGGTPNMTSEELADVLVADLLQLHEDAETGVVRMPNFEEDE